jgi:hypothetical protein
MHSVGRVTGGVIDHNVIRYVYLYYYYYIYATQVTNNIFRDAANYEPTYSSNNQIFNNIDARSGIGENSIVPDDWDEVFVGPDNGITITSNFHLKAGHPGKTSGTNGSEIGIYGGSGFSDSALPPGPRIVSKVIADQTDENGNLRVQIEVRVGD